MYVQFVIFDESYMSLQRDRDLWDAKIKGAASNKPLLNQFDLNESWIDMYIKWKVLQLGLETRDHFSEGEVAWAERRIFRDSHESSHEKYLNLVWIVYHVGLIYTIIVFGTFKRCWYNFDFEFFLIRLIC